MSAQESTVLQAIPSSKPVTKLEFNNAGTFLAIGLDDGSIVLWNMKAAEIDQSLTGHRAMISDLRFRKDDLFLLSTSYDGAAMLWNMQALNQRQVILNDHGGWVLQACFDEGRQNLITADTRGSLRHFPLNMEVYASRLCEKLHRDMTEKEWISFVGEDVIYQKTCQK
jgi:WD40 repeat protein